MIYRNSGNLAVLGQIKGTGKRILDVGCGAGDNARILVGRGHIVDGITLSDEEATECSSFMRKVFVHNLETGLPEAIVETYDYIICSHVLEHIAYPEKLFKDITCRLQESGIMIVALPNIMHYRPRMKLILGRFEYADSGIWDRTHLRWYTYSSGKRLLEQHGFKVVRSWVDGGLPFYRISRMIPANIQKVIYQILTAVSPGLFGGQLLYESRPRR